MATLPKSMGLMSYYTTTPHSDRVERLIGNIETSLILLGVTQWLCKLPHQKEGKRVGITKLFINSIVIKQNHSFYLLQFMNAMKKVLVLDNYDSFTYNLVHLLKELGAMVEVHRNDQISLEAVDTYEKILLSPGPGVPSEAGIMPALIRQYAPTKSIFGVCLGHQAIGEAFGCELQNMPDVYHGVAHTITVQQQDWFFQDIPTSFLACRYHSWTVLAPPPHSPIEVLATDENGQVMALRHARYNVRGVQFHPESILTQYGREMLQNWLAH